MRFLTFDQLKITRPLKIRDFRLLWIGETVSLLGDGLYFVALAWQVYELSNAPTALSAVGLAWTAPMLVFLLLSGVLTDRFDRRRILIASDVIRGVAIIAIGLLSVTGRLELWHMFVLVAVYGVGEAFFGPAFGAIVPDLVPRSLLVEANSLGQFVRPLAERMVGPALGGLIVAGAGVGNAFLIDAGSFVVSGACIYAIRASGAATGGKGWRTMGPEIAEGLRFVRSQTWLWATLAAASLSLLFWIGPFEVLMPFVVKNHLDAGADALGLVFAAGGVGSVLVAVAMAQRGLPRRHIVVMYVSFAVAVGAVAGFAFVTEVWQAMVFGFVDGGAAAVGLIVWNTLMHSLVPRHLLGRVQSIDWMISISFVPLSFALAGPFADTFGVDNTLIGAGVLGAGAMLLFMAIPGLYKTERDGALRRDDERVDVEERSETLSH